MNIIRRLWKKFSHSFGLCLRWSGRNILSASVESHFQTLFQWEVLTWHRQPRPSWSQVFLHLIWQAHHHSSQLPVHTETKIKCLTFKNNIWHTCQVFPLFLDINPLIPIWTLIQILILIETLNWVLIPTNSKFKNA